MQKELVVDVQPRAQIGKNASRRIRRGGLMPAIIYGGDGQPSAISVDPRTIIDILRTESGSNTIFTLRLDGREDMKRAVMIRDVQRDPLAGKLIHADFVRIDMTQEMTVKVPVHPSGTPIGVKTEGGLLDFVLREVEVVCLPADIPGSIEVDVSELHVGQHVTAAEIKLPENVKLVTDPAQTLLVITVPKAEAEPVAAVEAEAAAPAEPEVIKKGKEVAEGEEGKDKGDKDKDRDKEKGESKPR